MNDHQGALPAIAEWSNRTGMIGYIEVQGSAPVQFNEDEYIKDTESACNHYKEVTSYDGLGVIVYEGQPALDRIGGSAWALGQILADSAGRNSNTQLQFQLVGDVLLSPSRIFFGYLKNQTLEVFGQSWLSR